MTLDPEDVEAVAGRVAELLQEERPAALAVPGLSARLVDAATMARLLGVSRTTVYAKAEELGAIRVGSGKRARLRFDPARAIGAPSSSDSPARVVPSRWRRARRTPRPDSGKLLPIRGGEINRPVP
jgi:hypothetical protein